MNRICATLLLAAAMVRADGDDLEALLRGLEHPDAQRRRAALAWLTERTDPPWERLVPLLDSPDVEVRRAIRNRVRHALRWGARETRLEILDALEKVQAAHSLLPSIAALTRESDPELAGRSMITHMRIGQHRKYVAELAASRGTWIFLRDFDPERDSALRATAQWYARLQGTSRGGDAGVVREYLDLLAAGAPESTTYLADAITDANENMLEVWVEIAAHHALLPASLGPVLAERVRKGAPAQIATIVGSLVQGDPLWGEAAQPVLEAALAREAEEADGIRVYLLLLLARCAPSDPRVRALLAAGAKRDDAVGITTACLLHGLEPETTPDPVARLRALDPADRLRVLARLIELGTAEVMPPIRDRLLHGEVHERRVVFSELRRIRARHLLLPDLETVMRSDNPWHVDIAVRAAAQVDPLLESGIAEKVLLDGLAHAEPRVRAAALYACDDLWRFGERIPGVIVALLRSKERSKGRVGVALSTMLGSVGDRGRHARAFLPLLSDIVRQGPPPHVLEYKSASTFRYECLKAAIEIDPRAPETRAACRAALASRSTPLKLKALGGYLRVQAPTEEDKIAVASVLEDDNENVRAYAHRVLQRGGWR